MARFAIAGADAYERAVGRFSRALAPAFLAFCGPMPGRVLDVGCGTGASTGALLAADPASEVAGIDVDASLVARALERVRDPRARFGRANAPALPFRDASFDHAVFLLVVNFLPDRCAACERRCA